MCAKAILDQALYGTKSFIPNHFTTAFYKQILGIEPHYQDFSVDDPPVLEILSMDVTDLMLDFTVTVPTPEGNKTIPLRPEMVAVTEENKVDYLRELARYRFRTSVGQQIDAFMRGFHFVLSKKEQTKVLDCLCENFDETELEMLLCGESQIDLAEWQARENMRYFNCDPTHRVIRWFWAAVSNMTTAERSRLLQFVTGSSQIPIGGFAAFSPKFGIELNNSLSPTSCPLGKTCFNLLVLPNYTNPEILSSRLHIAINEGAYGFELI